MGGNALSNTSVRLTKREYARMEQDCVAKLQALYPGNRVRPVQAYRSKYDFGDLDILVESTGYDPFVAAAALNATEVVRNGPCTSIGVKVRPEIDALDGNVFQVDMISAPSDEYEFHYRYLAYNDLGNLVGRTAHKAGLAHCHNGLFYFVRDGDYLFRKICLTQDYDEALVFQGYDPVRYAQGFDTLTDIFEYVAASRYFNREIFLLENRDYRSRVRDRKRATYSAFLKWCEDRPDLQAYQYPEHKAEWLPRIAQAFPHFQGELDAAHAQIEANRQMKSRYNGEYVSSVTGRQDKELGMLMKHVKASFETPADMQAFMLNASDQELRDRILQVEKSLT